MQSCCKGGRPWPEAENPQQAELDPRGGLVPDPSDVSDGNFRPDTPGRGPGPTAGPETSAAPETAALLGGVQERGLERGLDLPGSRPFPGISPKKGSEEGLGGSGVQGGLLRQETPAQILEEPPRLGGSDDGAASAEGGLEGSRGVPPETSGASQEEG